MLNVAIHNYLVKVVKGILKCIFTRWMIGYLSIIKVIFDIVSRAVEANIREYMPTARTNKEKIEYSETRFLDIIAIFNCCDNAIAIARQKSNFAVFDIVLRICVDIKGGDVDE